MGIEHVNYLLIGSKGPKKMTYHYPVTEISNDGLMWQIRLCEKPGEVKVVAAFLEKEDAKVFMDLISAHGEHKIEEKWYKDRGRITGFGTREKSYSIEHNSSTEFVEL